MPKPLKISENNAPLSCKQHDDNIDALLDRRNHTNKIEDCESAIDQDSLDTCVSNLNSIKVIDNSLSDLKSKYELLNESIEPNGNIETSIQAIDSRLNENVTSINSALISIAVDLELIEEGNTAVSSIFNLNQLLQKKNSVTSPRPLTRFTLKETKDNLNNFIDLYKPIVENNEDRLDAHLNPTNGTFTVLNNYVNNIVKPVVNNQTTIANNIKKNKDDLATTNSILGNLLKVDNRTVYENLVFLIDEVEDLNSTASSTGGDIQELERLVGPRANLSSDSLTRDIRNNRDNIRTQTGRVDALSILSNQNKADIADVEKDFRIIEKFFKVEQKPGTNLGLIVNGGPYRTSTGTRSYMQPQEVSAVSGKPNYVYLQESGNTGSVTVSEEIIETGILLATVNTSGGKIQGIFSTFNMPVAGFTRPYNVKKLGGNCSGDYVSSGRSDVITGLQFYESFYVRGGDTVTIRGGAKIVVTNTFRVDGRINVETIAAGGPSLTEVVNGQYVGNKNSGGLSNRRSNYHWTTLPAGSGGRSGIAGSNSRMEVFVPRGGDGGGGLIVEAGGNIRINGIIEANGGNGQEGSIRNAAGPGGVAGGGGGAGGCVVLMSGGLITIGSGATINCKGGNGGDANTLGSYKVLGSGAGGGGWISLYAKSINRESGSTLSCSPGTEGRNGDGNYTVYSAAQGGGIGGAFGGKGGNGSSFTVSERRAQSGGIEFIYQRPNF